MEDTIIPFLITIINVVVIIAALTDGKKDKPILDYLGNAFMGYGMIMSLGSAYYILGLILN